MKKIFAVMLVLALLTTVFSFAVVEAKSKSVSLTGEIIKVSNEKSRNSYDVLALKCEDGEYILTGNTKGMKNYINRTATVYGTVSNGTKGPMFLKVKEYKIIQEPEPTPVETSTPIKTNTYVQTPIPEPITTQASKQNELKGTLFIKDSTSVRFLLKTENGIYELMGNTKGLENEFGNTLLVAGDYVYTLVATEYPLFSVKSYTVIGRPEPTPTPVVTPDPTVKTITIKGALTVTKTDIITEGSLPYNYLLNTQSGPVTLNGNTKGLEKYNGLDVEVLGSYSLLKIYPPIFIVESYKLVSVPTPTVKTITMDDNGGYVYIKPGDEVKLELETNPTTGYDWSYIMKPNQEVLLETNYEFVPDDTTKMIVGSGGKGVWTYKALKRDTVVIEMGYSRSWESVEPLKTFIVKVIIEETVTPVPTSTPVAKTHTIISDKALKFAMPDVPFVEAAGFTTISWTQGTESAFFSSKLNVGKDVYEFELVYVKASDYDNIIGLFNIKKNGELVMKEISGQLYGLSQPVGSYFKFYSEDMNCHMSAYITNRLDF